MTRRSVMVLAAMGFAPGALRSQDLLPSTGWGGGIAVSAWSFGTPLPQGGQSIRGVVQVAMPLRLTAIVANRWRIDASGAWATGGALVQVDSADDSGRLVSLQGPTDMKLRLTGPLLGERLFLTAGLNLPTGRTGLGFEETTALQAMAAPAFRMPVASFGSGLGYTLGAIQAFERGAWTAALGASIEQRTAYTPIALALSDGRVETTVTPGSAIHVTGAVDRPIGESIWSLMVVADVFSTDRVSTSGSATSYQLGPQLTIATQLRMAGGGWRSGHILLSAQRRSEFLDSAKVAVDGSSGNTMELSLGGVRGREGSIGFVLGADVRRLSGLAFTDALVGLAASTAGFTLGLEVPRANAVWRVVLRGQRGSFDTGTAASSGTGLTLGVTLASRGGPR